MIRLPILLSLAALFPGCVDSRPDDSNFAPPSGTRPAGVALCYSELSSGHEATLGFWDVFAGGRPNERVAALKSLTAASDAHPNEEEFALLLGLGHLWRIAEPLPEEAGDLGVIVSSATGAIAALERANELCPTDHRIPTWLGPMRVRMGRELMDPNAVEAGMAILEQGIEDYPSFVLFSDLLVHADLPASDPAFLRALSAVEENLDACAGNGPLGLSDDPACRNHPRAYHNIEGASVFMGDVFAKAGQNERALAFYEQAKESPDFERWPYRDVLEERIATFDARRTAYALGIPEQAPDEIWKSEIQCSLCHRR